MGGDDDMRSASNVAGPDLALAAALDHWDDLEELQNQDLAATPTDTAGNGAAARSQPAASSPSAAAGADNATLVSAPPQSAPAHLLHLPHELQLRVWSFLSVDDLCKSALICWVCKHLSEEQVLWRRLYCARWGKPAEQEVGAASWKAQYQARDAAELQSMAKLLEDEGGSQDPHAAMMAQMYKDMQRARRQQTLGRGRVDDTAEVPRSSVQAQLDAWRAAYPPVPAGQPPRTMEPTAPPPCASVPHSSQHHKVRSNHSHSSGPGSSHFMQATAQQAQLVAGSGCAAAAQGSRSARCMQALGADCSGACQAADIPEVQNTQRRAAAAAAAAPAGPQEGDEQLPAQHGQQRADEQSGQPASMRDLAGCSPKADQHMQHLQQQQQQQQQKHPRQHQQHQHQGARVPQQLGVVEAGRRLAQPVNSPCAWPAARAGKCSITMGKGIGSSSSSGTPPSPAAPPAKRRRVLGGARRNVPPPSSTSPTAAAMAATAAGAAAPAKPSGGARGWLEQQEAARPDLSRGRGAYTWDRIGNYFCCRETGWIHLCDHSCKECIIDRDHDLLVCPISGSAVDRMLTEWELRDLARARAGPVGHDEADFAGFVGRAYEAGYSCHNDKEFRRMLGGRGWR